MFINLQCPINTLSYGYTGLNFLKNLIALNSKVAYFPIGQVEVDSIDGPLVQESFNLGRLFPEEFHYAPSLRIYHQFSMAESIGNGKRFGFPIFELDNFNKYEVNHLKSLGNHSIIVPSQWAAQVIEEKIGVHAHVVPLGYDPSIFINKKESNNTFVFLNIGKWELRKGHDFLIQAFENAFEPSDRVELWMACHNPFLSEDDNKRWAEYYTQGKLGGKVRIFPRFHSQAALASVMAQADCGIFPSRAEGWNLPALEMMGMSKEIIITNYSAHTEFCNDDNSHLLSIDEYESAYDGIWFHNQGNWASLNDKVMEQCVNSMRKVVKREDIKGDVAREFSKQFTWYESAKKLINVMEI